MIDILFILILIAQIIFSLIVFYNFLSKITLKDDLSQKFNFGKLSILIPFRNEEKNVEEFLKSLLMQDLENTEIICLNDNSEDKTGEMLQKFSADKKNIKVINGKPLPDGWIGKNWACHQLAENSIGDYLIFIDADVRLNKNAIKSAFLKMNDLNASMLSVFPSQIMKSLSEFLIVPSMNWLLLTFLPLKFVYKISNPAFVAANGQFIVIKRDAYFAIGGHKSVKNKPVEDMELARLLKKNGYKIVTLLGGHLIFARMYESFNEALNGFSKNFYPGFSTSYLKFSFLLGMIALTFLAPFILMFLSIKYFLIVGAILIQKILISKKSNQKIIPNLILTPIQLFIVIFIGIRSMILSHKGKLEWKGRKLIIGN
ncbi:MAG: glycosyltransferase family 2 protein [Ignavibacteria bacterium]|jgi:chlorobactene glucosyltransferase